MARLLQHDTGRRRGERESKKLETWRERKQRGGRGKVVKSARERNVGSERMHQSTEQQEELLWMGETGVPLNPFSLAIGNVLTYPLPHRSHHRWWCLGKKRLQNTIYMITVQT